MERYSKKQLKEMFPDAYFAGSALLGNNVEIGKGCRIAADVVLGDEVILHENVTLFQDASIDTYCRVGSDSTISGRLSADVTIGRGVNVGRLAQVSEMALIGDKCQLGERSFVGSHTVLGEGVVVGSGASVMTHVSIENHVWIYSEGVIPKKRKGVRKTLVIKGLGSTETLTAIDCNDGLIIAVGCFNGFRGGNVNEFKYAVSRKYEEGHAYYALIPFIKKWHKSVRAERSFLI